jgi:LuxR family maltose regulon positive regulatory protein
VLARIAASRSNIEHAYALLEQAVSLGYSRRWGRLCAAVEVERVRLYLGEGRLTEASACLAQLDRLVDEYPAPARCAWSEISEYRSLAKSLLAPPNVRSEFCAETGGPAAVIRDPRRSRLSRFKGLCWRHPLE